MIRTTNVFNNLQQLRVCQRMAVDTASLRPDTLVVDGFSNNACNILYGRECPRRFVFCRDDCASVFDIDVDVEQLDMLSGLVRSPEIVGEKSELEQRVFQYLRRLLSVWLNIMQ